MLQKGSETLQSLRFVLNELNHQDDAGECDGQRRERNFAQDPSSYQKRKEDLDEDTADNYVDGDDSDYEAYQDDDVDDELVHKKSKINSKKTKGASRTRLPEAARRLLRECKYPLFVLLLLV